MTDRSEYQLIQELFHEAAELPVETWASNQSLTGLEPKRPKTKVRPALVTQYKKSRSIYGAALFC